MKLFIDTNVVVDAYSRANRNRKESSLLLALGEMGEFDLLTSPSQWTDVFYILTSGGKPSKYDEGKAILQKARKQVGVCMMGEQEVDKALDSKWDDFEDALVYQAVLSSKADVLITNNKKDFARSEIPTYTCAEFFEWMKNEQGTEYDIIENFNPRHHK